MAKRVTLKDYNGNVCYPATHASLVQTSSGGTVGDELLNKIDLSQLDFSLGMIGKILTANVPCRFTVIKKGKNVGLLDCYSDESNHMFTQEFTTHYLLPFTGGSTTHTDDITYKYVRSYHITGGSSSIKRGTWGEWKQVYSSDNQKDVDALKLSVNNLNANTGIDEYETFSEAKEYPAGYTLLKDGLLYTFKVDHAAGAWNDDEVESVRLRSELSSEIEKTNLSTIGQIYICKLKSMELYLGLKQNYYLTLELISSDSPSPNISAFLFYDKEHYDGVGGFNKVGDKLTVTLSRDYLFLRFYNNLDNANFSVKVSINSLENKLNALNENLDDVTKEVNSLENRLGKTVKNSYTLKPNLYPVINYAVGTEFVSPTNADTLEITSDDLFKQNNKILITLLECGDDSPNISAFLFYDKKNYDAVGSFRKIGDKLTVTLSKDYLFLRFYNNNKSKLTYKVRLSINGLDLDIYNINKNSGVPTIRALILGDSYSQNGGNWIKPMMSYFPNGSSWISLAVSSASVKDRYADRETYPYTSRPISSENGGNLNTLSCQIEKLKRLMEGTDLDEGENKLYSTEEEYPNVVIIEGGMNDTFDTDEKELTYFNQFEKQVNSVYIKQNSSSEISQGSCYIQTPIDEIDRTCFAGAYRYLVQSILDLFPNAQIFITTASGLGYWHGSVVESRYKTALQQRKCANLCAASVIDWSAEGQISSIVNHPSGSGTEEDPYIWGEVKDTGYNDTGDAMHPNARGGKKYGRLAALSIIQRFMDISNY